MMLVYHQVHVWNLWLWKNVSVKCGEMRGDIKYYTHQGCRRKGAMERR